jgi:hypothetical protein
MANQPWRFIKIQNWLCGGFAHTRGTYIILSQAYLDRLSTDWSDNMTEESELKLVTSLGGLLVHEQMHSLQRTFKSKFKKLYSENWNFINQQIRDDQEIVKDQVSNPDAPIAEWLIPDPEIRDRFYWIRTLITKNIEIPEMGKDFVDVAFDIFKDKENYSLIKLNNTISSRPLSDSLLKEDLTTLMKYQHICFLTFLRLVIIRSHLFQKNKPIRVIIMICF